MFKGSKKTEDLTQKTYIVADQNNFSFQLTISQEAPEMSGFFIEIRAGKDQQSSSVNVTGNVQHIITDTERATFQLKDSQLKEAVKTYFGKKPDDAYLHSPTKHDLYNTYNWQQTQTVIVSTSAEILAVTSEPQILKTQTFENDSSKEATFNVSISDSVTDSVTSSWQQGGEFTVDQKIKYNVEILGTGGGGETGFSYTDSWGASDSKSQQVTVGSNSGIEVQLQPGESVVAELSAYRGVMKVRVRYNSYLIGTTANNYSKTYKGHHFWDFSTPSVMSTSSISNSIVTVEDMDLGYYSNGKVTLVDSETKAVKEERYL